MTITLFTDVPVRAPAYQPRHRSRRWVRGATGQLGQSAHAVAPPCGPEPRAPYAQVADLGKLSAPPDLLDYLTPGQLRCLLEACASSDHLRAVPHIAYLVAHQSHTAATLTAAWDSFRQSTRDAYALRRGSRYWWEFFSAEELGPVPRDAAVEKKFRFADDAWQLIINGPPWRRDERSQRNCSGEIEERSSFPEQ